MPEEWQRRIDIPPEIESELKVLARNTPTNTGDFLDYLLRHRQRFREAVMLSAMPDRMRDEIGELMNRRFEIQAIKEKAVNEGSWEQAANYLENQDKLSGELNEKLIGQTLFVTIENVKQAIAQIGWPD